MVTLDVGIWISKERFELEIRIRELMVVLKATEMGESLTREQRQERSQELPRAEVRRWGPRGIQQGRGAVRRL